VMALQRQTYMARRQSGPGRRDCLHCTRKTFLTQIIPIYIRIRGCYRVRLAGHTDHRLRILRTNGAESTS
jgi:hypothetical protein